MDIHARRKCDDGARVDGFCDVSREFHDILVRLSSVEEHEWKLGRILLRGEKKWLFLYFFGGEMRYISPTAASRVLCVRVLLYSFLNCKFISYITIYVL